MALGSGTLYTCAMTRLGWGLLGAGKIAAMFAENLLAEGLAVTAVGARSGAKAAEFADRLGIEKSHEGYDALLADPAVDIVYVNTTQNFHVAHALLAIEAGKPVLVEKSFTRNAAEAQLIADAARANGVFAMEAMWTRFVPTMVRLREWIASGVLGEITAVMSDHSQSLSTSAEGRHHNPELGGGALLDLGVYNASFAHDLLGVPTEILGRGRLTATGVDAEVSMLFVHEGGAQSTHHTSMVNPGPNNAAVIGTLGCVEVDATFYNWTSMTRFDTSRTREPVERFEPTLTSRGMHFQALEVERCVREGLGESPLMTLDDSVAVMATLDELRRQLGVVYPGE